MTARSNSTRRHVRADSPRLEAPAYYVARWGGLGRLIAVKLWHKIAGIQLKTIIFVELFHVTPPTILEQPVTNPKTLNTLKSTYEEITDRSRRLLLRGTWPTIARPRRHKAPITHLSPEPVTSRSYWGVLNSTIIPSSNSGDGSEGAEAAWQPPLSGHRF